MNHRIFERTLHPLVFQRVCLFERHFSLKPQGLVLSDTLSFELGVFLKFIGTSDAEALSLNINVLGLSNSLCFRGISPVLGFAL